MKNVGSTIGGAVGGAAVTLGTMAIGVLEPRLGFGLMMAGGAIAGGALGRKWPLAGYLLAVPVTWVVVPVVAALIADYSRYGRLPSILQTKPAAPLSITGGLNDGTKPLASMPMV